MFGAMKIASSRLSFIIPAMKWLMTCDIPYGSPAEGSLVSARSPAASQTLMWRWPEEPVHDASGLAMNVRPQPLR